VVPASKFLKTQLNGDKKEGKPVEVRNSQEREGETSGSDDEDGKVKWKSLEHHGVIFFEPYKPHGVPILHKVIIILVNLQLLYRANLLHSLLSKKKLAIGGLY
jgi:hypothetical protein